VLGKTQDTASRNLKLLERFMADHRDVLGWIPPQGGMTAFPWLLSGEPGGRENDRPFCQAAAERGILLAPGDCFDAPSHFRLGFAAAGDNFPKALDRFGSFKELGGKDGHSMMGSWWDAEYSTRSLSVRKQNLIFREKP
jgi:aspartate/methionine/tyrosine aminotransferase